MVPHSHFETRDGAWVALACSNDRMWQRLARAMQRPELGDHPNYATMAVRLDRRVEVNAIVATWMAGLSVAEVLRRCAKEEVPCAKLLAIDEIFADPQYAARRNLLQIDDPRVGAVTIPAGLPFMSRTPPVCATTGPELGAHNREVFEMLLGLDAKAIAELQERKIV